MKEVFSNDFIRNIYSSYFIVVKGSVFINKDTAVEHPKADPGSLSLVFVAHFV